MRHPEAGNDEECQNETDERRDARTEERDEGPVARRNRQIDQIQDEQGNSEGKDAVGKA